MSEDVATLIVYFLFATPFLGIGAGFLAGYWTGRVAEKKNLIEYLRTATEAER